MISIINPGEVTRKVEFALGLPERFSTGAVHAAERISSPSAL